MREAIRTLPYKEGLVTAAITDRQRGMGALRRKALPSDGSEDIRYHRAVQGSRLTRTSVSRELIIPLVASAQTANLSTMALLRSWRV